MEGWENVNLKCQVFRFEKKEKEKRCQSRGEKFLLCFSLTLSDSCKVRSRVTEGDTKSNTWKCAHTHTHTDRLTLLLYMPSLPDYARLPAVPLKYATSSKFFCSFMLIPISISGVNKPLQLGLMRLYHGEGSSGIRWGVKERWLSLFPTGLNEMDGRILTMCCYDCCSTAQTKTSVKW